MSSEFETWISSPASLSYDPALTNDLRQRYREIDAPLTRYILGAIRHLAGLSALPSDWDWSSTWQVNQQNGALPGETLLYIGRLGMTLLLPFSLFFIYLIGNAIGSRSTGLLAVLLLGTNALVLLHDRRAMAEGILTLGVILSLWGFLHGDQRPWLAGLCMGLAFCAKQTTLALLPAGLLAVAWLPKRMPHFLRKIGVNIILYLGVFTITTLLLNPIWWNHPVEAISASLAARQDLLQKQFTLTKALIPDKLLNTPTQRVAGILANLFIVPPAFSEAGNYLQETAIAETTYLSIPGHNLLRGFFSGGVFLVFTIFGMVLTTLKLFRNGGTARRNLTILMISFFLQISGLIAAIPFATQRYVIPLVPFVCIFSAYGLVNVLQSIYPKISPSSKLASFLANINK